MKKISVKVKKLENFRGSLPAYESASASGFDLCAQLEAPLLLQPGARVLVPTGLAVEIPPGYEIQIRPRSGWAAKKGVTVVNAPGTIDADYRGEIKIALINLGQEALEIAHHDRVAQAVLCPVFQAELVESDTLTDTHRGAGGFGSTGFRSEKALASPNNQQSV